MNFKDWEKISEDGKTCTLRHPKGHTMSIALKALPKIHQEQIKRLNFVKGGDVPAADDSDSNSSSPPASPGGTVINIGAQPASQAPPAQAAPDVRSIGAQFKQGPPSSSPISVPESNDQVQVKSDGRATGPIALEQQAIGEQQAIDTEKAKQTAQNEAAIVGKRQDLAQQDADNIQDLKKHTDEYADYIKQNPINAHAFQDSLGTGQKITAGLGLFLGGLGTPFGGQNVALDMLNKQIDRNIDAQKQNAEQQKNVWGAYEHLYGDQNIATNLAKISANDILVHQANLLAAQLGTPQAKANADMLSAQKGKENATLFGITGSRQTGIRNGTIRPNPGPSGMARIKAMGPQVSQSGFENVNIGGGSKEAGFMPPMPGASNNSENPAPTEQILGPKAQTIYDNLKYDHVHTPEQIAKATEQYGQAQKTDRILKQIDSLFPEMRGKATAGGWLSSHIDPHAIAAVGGATGLGLGAMGGLPIAGVGAIPAAAAGATAGTALGEGAGHLMQAGARAIGGRQESEYQTDKAALIGYVGNALAGTKVTPSEIESLVSEFLPTKADNDASANNKLKKLKEKIVTLANTDALDAFGMTHKGK